MFRIVPVVGDGNCLFRATSVFLFGTESTHERLRQEAAVFVREHWDDLGQFTLTEVGHGTDSKAYFDFMIQEGTYGTSVECLALSRLYHILFKIYSLPDYFLQYKYNMIYIPTGLATVIGEEGTERTIYILMSGDKISGHFDLLIPLSYNDLMCNNTDTLTTIKETGLQTCPYCGKKYKGLNIHIGKTHPLVHKGTLDRKYTHRDLSSGYKYFPPFKTYQKDDVIWKTRVHNSVNNSPFKSQSKTFNTPLFFQSLSKSSISKQRSVGYYKLRKLRSCEIVSSNKEFESILTVEQKAHRDKLKRTKEYLHKLAQLYFYNEHHFTFRKVTETVCHRACKIPLQEMVSTFKNAAVSIKLIRLDTSPGPDQKFFQSLESPKFIRILALIINRTIQNGFVSFTLKKARTIMIFKQENSPKFNNWKSISISSLIRKIIEWKESIYHKECDAITFTTPFSERHYN